MATRSAPEEVPHFDLSNPEFSALADEVHAARDKAWFARSNYGVVALRHEQVGALLRDRRLRHGLYSWPELNGVTEGPLHHWWINNLNSQEGDDHRRYRRLLNPLFAPKSIERMAPGFQALTHELIDRFAPTGRCEFVSEFCEEFSARILLQLVGVGESSWRELQRMCGEFGISMGVNIAKELPRIEAALAELYEFTDELIAARRADPGEDAITGLVKTCDSGELTGDELRNMIVMLVFGGLDTTKNQMGIALDVFMRHPDQWDLLAERPELGGRAVEEVLRIEPTVLWISREALEDVEIEGLAIPQGTTVHLLTESASTDPLVGGDVPFDITAEHHPRHLAFGGGPHHCVGHYLARTDMREALPILAKRLRNPRADGPAEFRPWTGLGGPLSLPIAFDPGDAEGRA
ncbi:MAG: cytochrome P450 [Solirubrobacterales bacterium]|nr:cytochrome P450 [Solirubrobacterales bacterium]